MADVVFGGNTGRHNFKLGGTQVDRLYRGEDVVWVNETTQTFTFTGQGITWTTPTPFTGIPGESIATPIDVFGTISGGEIEGTAVLDMAVPDGLTITSSIISTGVDNQIRLRIEGTYPLSSNIINFTVSGLTTYSFSTVTWTHSGSVGAGLSIPGTSSDTVREDDYPFTRSFSVSAANTVLQEAVGTNNRAVWSLRNATPATPSRGPGVGGSGSSFTVNGPGTYNISWSGGSVNHVGFVTAEVSGSISPGGAGLSNWSSVGNVDNQTASITANMTINAVGLDNSASVGNTQFGHNYSFNPQPPQNQLNLNGTQDIALTGNATTVWGGMLASNLQSGSGVATFQMSCNGVSDGGFGNDRFRVDWSKP